MKKLLIISSLFVSVYCHGAGGLLTPVLSPAGGATSSSTVTSIITGLVPFSVLTNTVYIATNGSDANAGTKASPFATLTNAQTVLGNSGTIYVLGGDYTNQSLTAAGSRLTIRGYNQTIPARFWGGLFISSNSFVACTNGLWTNTPSAAFSNAITYELTFQLPNSFVVPLPLYQLFTPYGTQGSNYLYVQPLLGGLASISNRCRDWPLQNASTPTSIINSNGYFAWTNGEIFVKFVTSNVVCDVMLPSTNTFFVGGCDALTDITVRNIQTCGYWVNYSLANCDRAILDRNYIVDGGLRNISVDSGALDIKIFNNEIVGSYGNNVDFGNIAGNQPMLVVMENNSIHDFGEIAVHASGNVVLSARFNAMYGGTNGIASGLVSDAATVNDDVNTEIGFRTYINQMGAATPGTYSSMRIRDSFLGSYGNQPNITVNGSNSILNSYNTTFDGANTSYAVDASVNTASINVHLFNSVHTGGPNTPLIIGGGGISASSGSPQLSSHGVAFGNDVQANAGTFSGEGSVGIISANDVYSGTGYLLTIAGSNRRIIDANGLYYISTNAATIPSVATFNGAQTFWPSNTTHMYLLKSPANSTTWNSTNLSIAY